MTSNATSPNWDDQLKDLPEFQRIVDAFVDFSKIDPMVTEMGVHQIRIVASKNEQE